MLLPIHAFDHVPRLDSRHPVELIAEHLIPVASESPWLSRPLSQAHNYYAESSIGAAHWVQLSKALTRRGQWLEALERNRRSHRETGACCRLLAAHDEAVYDCECALAALMRRCRHCSELSFCVHHPCPPPV